MGYENQEQGLGKIIEGLKLLGVHTSDVEIHILNSHERQTVLLDRGAYWDDVEESERITIKLGD